MAGPVKLNEQQAQIAQLIAQDVYATLLHIYPLEPDRSLLQHHAQHAAVEQVMEMPKLLAMLNGGKVKHLRLVLERPSKLAGGKGDGLQMVAPWPIEDANTLDDTLRVATILGLVNSPVSRAVLAKTGHRLRFLVGTPKDDPKVTDINKARRKKKDE